MSKEENIKDLVLIQLNEDMACIKENIIKKELLDLNSMISIVL